MFTYNFVIFFLNDFHCLWNRAFSPRLSHTIRIPGHIWKSKSTKSYEVFLQKIVLPAEERPSKILHNIDFSFRFLKTDFSNSESGFTPKQYTVKTIMKT